MNVPLLRSVVRWVESESRLHWTKRQWRQSSWWSLKRTLASPPATSACGTTFCVAGYVAHLEGWEPVPGDAGGPTLFGSLMRDAEGRTDYADRIAATALGLNPSQEADLFDAKNTARDVRRAAECIAGDAGEHL